MIDRLPTPFGLVRAGVAPDHPKIKNVIRRYEKTAANEGFRFFGNVEVGADVSVAELVERYHAVIHAYGAATDRQLGIPGEDLPGSHAGHRLRRLVQRPPRLRRPRVRPHLRARRRDRQRQRRRRRRPDARADPRRARRDRHRRPRDRRAGLELRSARSSSSAAAGPPRPPSPTPRSASWARWSTPTSSSTPPTCELDEHSHAWLESDGRRHRPQERRHLHRLLRPRTRGQEPAGSSCASCARPIEIQGDGKVEKHRSSASTSSTSTRAARCAPATPASARRSSAAWCCARSATGGRRSRACPSTSAAATISNEGGRVTDPETGEQVAGPVRRRLDQARPERRDRHQQEGRPGDGRQPGRGPRRRARSPRSRPHEPRSTSSSPSASPTRSSASRAGRRSTPPRRARGEPHGRPRVKFCRVDEMLDASRAGQPVGAE